MKNEYKIALDIDDVLAQFWPAVCKKANVKIPKVDIWDYNGIAGDVVSNSWVDIRDNINFWMNLEKESDPRDINFNISAYITSSPKHLLEFRRAWLDLYGFPKAPVISTTEKVFEMKSRGIDVLVDDKPETLKLVKKAGLIPIQYVPSYMSDIHSDLNPITHLSEVNQAIEHKTDKDIIDSLFKGFNSPKIK